MQTNQHNLNLYISLPNTVEAVLFAFIFSYFLYQFAGSTHFEIAQTFDMPVAKAQQTVCRVNSVYNNWEINTKD